MENLLEIILFVVYSLFTTIASSFAIYCISSILMKKKYSIKVLCISILLQFPFCMLNNYILLFAPKLKVIAPTSAIIVCVLIMLIIYKCHKITKIIYMVTLYSIFTFLIDVLFAIFIKMIGLNASEVAKTLKLQCLLGIVPNVVICLLMFILLKLNNRKNISLPLKDSYKYIIYQSIAIFICLIPSMYMMFSHYFNYPIAFVIINALQLIIVSVFSILYLRKGILYKETQLELENTKLHNKALSTINENIRGFKHDMGNMVQSINGYLSVGNIDGVKAYCQNLLQGFNDVNLLSILSPKIINEPAIYGVVVGKMLYAREKNLNLSLDIGLDVSSINFPSFELSRIIGILLDNAIEAALETEEKKIKLEMVYDESKNADVIIIGNSVSDPNKVDVIKMFEKDYSTKENPSGFGLFEVLKFLKKNQKGDIVPNIDYDKNFFTQTLTFDK